MFTAQNSPWSTATRYSVYRPVWASAGCPKQGFQCTCITAFWVWFSIGLYTNRMIHCPSLSSRQEPQNQVIRFEVRGKVVCISCKCLSNSQRAHLKTSMCLARRKELQVRLTWKQEFSSFSVALTQTLFGKFWKRSVPPPPSKKQLLSAMTLNSSRKSNLVFMKITNCDTWKLAQQNFPQHTTAEKLRILWRIFRPWCHLLAESHWICGIMLKANQCTENDTNISKRNCRSIGEICWFSSGNIRLSQGKNNYSIF